MTNEDVKSGININEKIFIVEICGIPNKYLGISSFFNVMELKS